MTSQISSNENFPIVYQLDDPTDSNTYYVQAKIYDGASGSLLSTVNLTDNGSQLFSKLVQAPADTSGIGRYIYIIIKVYIDSGHTSISARYGIQSNTYLVQDRITRGQVGGGGGYANINYPGLFGGISESLEELIRKILEEMLAETLSKIDPISYDKIGELIEDKTDYQSIKGMFGEHLSPVHETLKTLNSKMIEMDSSNNMKHDGTLALVSEHMQKTHQAVGKLYEEMDKKHDDTKKELSNLVENEMYKAREWIKNHVEKYIDYLEKLVEKHIVNR